MNPKPISLFSLSLSLLLAAGCESSTESDADASQADTTGNSGDAQAVDGSAPEGAAACDDESSPKILWFGPDNAGPCEGPCYEIVEGSVLAEGSECWSALQPVMCWRSGVSGDLPTVYQVEGVGLIGLSGDYFVDDELAAFGATRQSQWPNAPDCDQ